MPLFQSTVGALGLSGRASCCPSRHVSGRDTTPALADTPQTSTAFKMGGGGGVFSIFWALYGVETAPYSLVVVLLRCGAGWLNRCHKSHVFSRCGVPPIGNLTVRYVFLSYPRYPRALRCGLTAVTNSHVFYVRLTACCGAGRFFKTAPV